jgi:O-acetyl-ADP-ribose deacetylase (regulator of RNase III)
MEYEFRVIDPFKAIRTIIQSKGQFSIFLGAGTSIEAGVPTADMICQNIAEEIITDENQKRKFHSRKLLESENEKKQWLNKTVNWDDEENRYSSCIKYWYSQQTARVDFFRDLLRWKNPSFTQYATALLMHNGYLARTCITTNFDKLLEKGFSELNLTECQAIRLAEEAQYWKKEDDKCYCLKLHGDYDTYNVLNTSGETTVVNETLIQCTESLLNHSGLIMLGGAGREKSIHTLLDRLTTKENLEKGLLDYGILWGVYIGNTPPKDFSSSRIERAINESIKNGVIGKEVIKLMDRLSKSETQFGFFPIWGSGRFLWELIKLTDDEKLIQLSEPYLDHEIRVTDVFKRAGLSDKASEDHLKQLKIQKKKISQPQQQEKSEKFISSQLEKNVQLTVAYGDISSESMLDIVSEGKGIKAIMSPDDTCLSVGGGAALTIGEKAGLRKILFELSKFSPIELEDNVITSGGLLPVHYIIHVAGVKITEIGAYTSKTIIRNAAHKAIDRAISLGVECLWIPLLGAGVAKIQAKTSFRSILQAIRDCINSRHLEKQLDLIVAVFNESTLERKEITRTFREEFPKI